MTLPRKETERFEKLLHMFCSYMHGDGDLDWDCGTESGSVHAVY